MTDIRDWFANLMQNRELTVLLITVPVVLILLYLLLDTLSPIFVGVLLAYLLERPVKGLERFKMTRSLSVSMVIGLFFVFLTIVMLMVVPRITRQLGDLINKLPESTGAIVDLVDSINDYMPAFLGVIEVESFTENLNTYLGEFGKSFLQSTLASVSDIFSLIVYGVLMPLLVFFLLRDKRLLFGWLSKFIPHNQMFGELYASVDEQFGAYIRGKIIEAAIVGSMSWIAFVLFDLNYAFVLALLVALSVIIPFVGAILVTFPVLIAGYLQFGNSDTFVYLVLVYTIIQFIDGQFIVPILFSEVVKIHPVGILVAIIFFGNVWGVWGVFFAIPLASLIKSFLAVIEKYRVEPRIPDVP